MKKLLLYAIATLVATTFCYAQSTVQLPVPSNVSITSGSKNTIFYGTVPPGGNTAPVLVFVHGYLGSGDGWFGPGNDMYEYAYNAGYRTAFAQLGPKDNMWKNGPMLANMLPTIKTHYGVSEVAMVGHSKGGVDTEAAMIHYGAHSHVDRAITLSTPFYGSQLADLAQTWWLSWVSWPLGQKNAATKVLQTSYMSYFRSITDGHPNNASTDFRTYGAWGYAWGVLHVPGLYIAAAGGGNGTGGNDGVVAYNKSQRPSGQVAWPGHPNNISKWDHFEVRQGSVIWSEIEAQLTGFLRLAPDAFTQDNYNPNAVSTSRNQIISSAMGENSFLVEPSAGKVSIEIRHPNLNDEFKIVGAESFELLPRNSKEIEDPIGGYATHFLMESSTSGSYEILTESPFIAIISTEKGIEITLKSDLSDEKLVYNQGERMNFELSLNQGVTNISDETSVTAVMRQTCDLEGNGTEESEPMILTFDRSGNTFRYTLDELLDPGIYNISLTASNNEFQKSLATSVAVVAGNEVPGINRSDLKQSPDFELGENYPNPVTTHTTFSVTIFAQSNATLTVYDLMGRKVNQYDLSDYQPGIHRIQWTPNQSSIQSGMYVYELKNERQRIAKGMLLTK